MNPILNDILLKDKMNIPEKEYFIFHLDRYDKVLKYITVGKNKDAKILEAGCGVGFLLRALHKLGYNNLFGCDNFELKYDSELINKYGVQYKKMI